MKLIAILTTLLLLAGCATMGKGDPCAGKDAFVKTFDLAQAGYSQYVTRSQTNNKDMILVDMILAIAGPFVKGTAEAWCPPAAVMAAVQDKAKELKVPLAVAAAGK